MDLMLSRIVAGVLLLILGRRLFWLFVGLVGFVAGVTFGAKFFPMQEQWLLILVAVGCGIVGIFLAIFLQRVAIAIAGFVAGGLFATRVLEASGWNIEPLILFVIGGIIGAILLSVWFDWALIFLSSITGAILIAQAVPWKPLASMALFVVLFIFGVLVQLRLFRTRRPRPDLERS